MDKSNLIISIIVVLCIAAAVAAYGLTNSDNPIFSDLSSMGSNGDNWQGLGNNSTPTKNPTSNDGSGSGNGDGSGGSSSGSSDSNGGNGGGNGQYSDWQRDYETGQYDSNGNPIYRSVISTSGGQNSPGIYEAYWSADGPISEQRIG